jgi:ribonucleoside-diphosphate reductase beta chain
MAYQQLWQCQLCGYVLDPAEGDADHGIMPRMSYEGIFPANWSCPVCGAGKDDFLPPGRRRGVRTLFAPISSFSRIVARLQWDATAIDLAPDARAWPGLSAARRRRLTTLLAGFRVAEDAVAEQLAPFGDATADTLVAWVFFLQRRDEERHALLFDRIAAEVLGLPGATPAQRRAAARAHVPAAVLELFEVRLPALAAELAAGRTGLGEGVGLYHMLLEGIVLYAGQRALLDDLAAGALPGVREGVERVELDERWHIGFGLRCLIEAQPSPALLDDLLARAEDAAAAWGDAVPPATRERIARMCARRLSIAGLTEAHAAV